MSVFGMLAPLTSIQVDAYYKNGYKQTTVTIYSCVTCDKFQELLLQTEASYMIVHQNRCCHLCINPSTHSGYCVYHFV
jgi:hypothetical protein